MQEKLQPITFFSNIVQIKEASRILRDLAQENPNQFNRWFAEALGLLGGILIGYGRLAEGTVTLNYAIGLIQPFADAEPDGRYEKLLLVWKDYLAKTPHKDG